MPEIMEVLEFFDEAGDTMVARLPEDGAAEIKWGAQLTVGESQRAMFFRDGRALALFKPGRYVLKTPNLPIVSKWITSFGYGETSPFRAEVYFINMKLFRNLKWGTKDPITFRDQELQYVRLRSYGIYSIQIKDAGVFLNHIVGTQKIFRDADIQDYLRNVIQTRFVDLLGTTIKTIFDLPKDFNEISATGKALLADDFNRCGLELSDFLINSITPTEEVQKMIDERTSMKAIGDMNTYTQFKTAQAIQDAAKSGGGTAGAGVGLGAGVGMGMMMPGMIKDAFQKQGVENQSPSTSISKAGDNEAFEKIKRLKELLDAGAITQAEFETKKAELLKQL